MATLHAGVPMISKEQSDIALLRKDIERVEQRAEQHFEVLEQRIDDLKDEIKSVETTLRSEIKSVETRIISSLRWFAVFVVSVIGAVIAFLTFWPW